MKYIVLVTLVLGGCCRQGDNALETIASQSTDKQQPAENTDSDGAPQKNVAAEEEISPLMPKLNTEVPNQWRCQVAVENVLEDENYRGHHDTPAHQAWVKGMSPEVYQMYSAESHNESYKLCTYKVLVKGKHWSYTETWRTTLHDVPPSWCEDAREHVAAAIQRTTRGCSNLHSGAYYGFDLMAL